MSDGQRDQHGEGCCSTWVNAGPCDCGRSGDLSDRITGALRGVGLARNLSAYRDAVLPIVQAEQERAWELADRITETHAQFSVLGQPDSEHCADWCHVCKLDRHRERAERAEAILRDLVDPDPCYFDHHGGCQTHGYLTLADGERCPHAEAKELLAALDQPTEARPGPAIKDNEEPDAPVNWEATLRQRERELNEVGEARHQAETAIARVRALHRTVRCDCPTCERQPRCGQCHVPEPCPTITALDQPGEQG